MQSYSVILISSICVSVISIIYTVLVGRKYLPYWPSISEAGAVPYCFKHYKFGMCVGAALLSVGLILFLIHSIVQIRHYKNQVNYLQIAACFGLTLFATYNMALQGAIKIQVELPDDVHRQAAGKFFLSTIFLLPLFCNLYNQVYRPTLYQRVMRYGTLFSMVANVVMQQVIMKTVQMDMSVPAFDGEPDQKYITQFSLLQYWLVASLFTGLASLIKF